MSYTPRTSPDHEDTGWPPGVRYIIGNEGCERFSYYGMRAILFAYIVSLYTQQPQYAANAEDLATSHYHLWVAGVYALPMIGAIIADRLLGKYHTILGLSLVYCLGHAVLSATEGSITGLWVGLGLIAVGSGGIKPCVSAHVGDQFGKKNWFRVKAVYQAFYFIINFGSFFATLLIPAVRDSDTLIKMGGGGDAGKSLAMSVAFAIPGVLMFIATLFFWMGRKVFVHVPPKPGGKLGTLDALSSVCLFMAVGHLFFTGSMPWYIIVGASIGFLVAGFALFFYRQRLEQDEGFLAVLMYALRRYFRGEDATSKADDVDSAALEKQIDSDNPDVKARRQKLLEHKLFGPAMRRFGVEAAEGPVAVLKIISVFFLVSIFWALFDQHGSSWLRQAKMMDLTLWEGRQVIASQTPAVNPILVMLLIPIANFGIYPAIKKLGMEPTPLRRMTMGMLVTGLSFVAVALIQGAVDSHMQVAFDAGTIKSMTDITEIEAALKAGKMQSVSIWWQLIPYVIITLAEVMVSITGLEFAYTQAPTRMKSTIMGFWLLTVALGNVLVSLLAAFGNLPLATFFWVFAGLMAGAAFLFGLRAYFYRSQDYVQD